MKHYLYKIFADTAPQVVLRYLAKYGTAETVREAATRTFIDEDTGYTKNKLNSVVHTKKDVKVLLNGAELKRPELKLGEEPHDDVVVQGRWCGQPTGLRHVKPWDILIPLGHGQITPSNKILSNVCANDSNTETRTVNDLVGWFGPTNDNLDKNHVVIKLAMCFSGGAGGREGSSDCFARNLAMAMCKAGWKSIVVGGYKGELISPGIHSTTSDGNLMMRCPCPHCGRGVSANTGHAGAMHRCQCGKEFKLSLQGATRYTHFGAVELKFQPKKVQHVGSIRETDAKKSLVYFTGDGEIVDEQTMTQTKAILRRYPGSKSRELQVEYLTRVRELVIEKGLKDKLPGKVLVMLLMRLKNQSAAK